MLNNTFFAFNQFAYLTNDPINDSEILGHIGAIALLLKIIGAGCGIASGYYIGNALVAHFRLKGWKKWAVIGIATIGGFLLGMIFPVASIIYMAMRVVVSVIGSLVLFAAGWSISNMMYQHAIWAAGAPLSSKDNKKVVRKVKQSETYKKEIQKLIDENQDSTSFFNPQVRFSFYNNSKDEDLAYSIGRIDFAITGNKTESENKWKITVKGQDIYNFGEFFKGKGKKMLANTFGTILQYTGLLVPYTVKLNFTDYFG